MSQSTKAATPVGLESLMHLSPQHGTDGWCVMAGFWPAFHGPWHRQHGVSLNRSISSCPAPTLLITAACCSHRGRKKVKGCNFSVCWSGQGRSPACCKQSWLCKSHYKALLLGREAKGWENLISLASRGLKWKAKSLCAATQSFNVFQMSPGFKQVRKPDQGNKMWMWLCVDPGVAASGHTRERFGDLPWLPVGTTVPRSHGASLELMAQLG